MSITGTLIFGNIFDFSISVSEKVKLDKYCKHFLATLCVMDFGFNMGKLNCIAAATKKFSNEAKKDRTPQTNQNQPEKINLSLTLRQESTQAQSQGPGQARAPKF
jgi:hypothetical protein